MSLKNKKVWGMGQLKQSGVIMKMLILYSIKNKNWKTRLKLNPPTEKVQFSGW
jgi:hypothetical protein